MPTEKKPWYKSIDNPEKLSRTIKGQIIGLIPFVILFAKFQGTDVGEAELTGVIDATFTLGLSAFALYGEALSLFGLWRKMVKKFF